MSDDSARDRGTLWYVVWVTIVLMVAYPLSVGPAVWLLFKLDPDEEGWAWDAWQVVYGPFVEFATSFEVGEEIYVAYLELFLGPL